MCVFLSDWHPHPLNVMHQILPQQELYPSFPDPILGPGEQYAPFLWGWPGSPKKERRLGLLVMDGINLLS